MKRTIHIIYTKIDACANLKEYNEGEEEEQRNIY